MGATLHKTTKVFSSSVSTPAVDKAIFVVWEDQRKDPLAQDPAELETLLASEPLSKYWNIVGDTVTEMSVAEKSAKDAADAAAALVVEKAMAETAVDARHIKALSLVMLDEINTIRVHAALGLAARTELHVRTSLTNKINSI